MKPIIMNTEDIIAIRAGRKTQIRRVMKPQPILGKPWKDWIIDAEIMDLPTTYCPFGIRSDKLSVKEIWRFTRRYHFGDDTREPQFEIEYKDGHFKTFFDKSKLEKLINFTDKYKISCTPNFAWHSPVTMPAWMSRIELEITNIRIERLQDLTIEDVLGEGIQAPDWLLNIDSWHNPDDVMIEIYAAEYWNKYNPKYLWKSNPWTFVISFKAC